MKARRSKAEGCPDRCCGACRDDTPENVLGIDPKFHAVNFENRNRKRAWEQIARWLDTNGDGRLSESRTQILGNFRFDYAVQLAGCRSYSWFNRHIFKSHNAMDCDSHIWGEAAEQIRTERQHVVWDQQAPKPAELARFDSPAGDQARM